MFTLLSSSPILVSISGSGQSYIYTLQPPRTPHRAATQSSTGRTYHHGIVDPVNFGTAASHGPRSSLKFIIQLMLEPGEENSSLL